LAGTFASSRGFIPDDKGRIVSGPPLEQYASGPAIAARLAARRSGFTGTAQEVLEMAKFTNSEAWRIVNSAGSALGAAIAQLVNVLDPEAVVLGGGLGLVDGPYRFAIEIALQLQVWSDMHRDIPLISAGLRTDAGIIGAAMIAVPTAAK
jgi:glucokinase